MPEAQTELEILGASGGKVGLDNADSIRDQLLDPAIKQAKMLGVSWKETVVRLTPTEELRKLVELSDTLGPTEEDEADDQAASNVDAES